MIITIENLKLRTIIGIFEWEKNIKQDVVINVEIQFDGRLAAESDNIEDTVDYKKITKEIIKYVEEGRFNLIEKIAGGVAEIVIKVPKVLRTTVKVAKPGALRYADSVSVTYTLEKE